MALLDVARGIPLGGKGGVNCTIFVVPAVDGATANPLLLLLLLLLLFLFLTKKWQSEPWLGGLVGEGAAAGQWGGGE